MANKTTNPAPVPAPVSTGTTSLKEISVLRDECNVSRAVFAGVCAAQGWASGKVVAKSEFLAAVEKFTKSPMGGIVDEKKEEKEAKK